MDRDNPNLDLLRTCAVLMVVVSHLLAYLGWPWADRFPLASLGYLGVSIFFVHTALVLMMSLQRQGAHPMAVPFLIRRVLRIYPLSIAVVIAVTLVAAASEPIDAATFAANLLLIQNLTGAPSTPSPLWSLPFEVQMYLLLPAIYLITARRGKIFVFGLWLGAGALVVAARVCGAPFLVKLLAFVPCFLSGVLAYVWMRDRDADASPPLPAAVLFAGVGVLAVIFPMAVATGFSLSAGPQVFVTVLSWVTCLALGIAIAACRRFDFPRLAAAARTIATYSYGIYLIHAPVMEAAFTFFTGQKFVASAAFALGTAALSWLAHWGIEQPGIRLGQSLAKHWTQSRKARSS